MQSFLQVFRSIVSNNFADCVNVRQVSSDSECVYDIVERQLGNQWAALHQQRKGLADTTWSSANYDLDIVLLVRRNKLKVIKTFWF